MAAVSGRTVGCALIAPSKCARQSIVSHHRQIEVAIHCCACDARKLGWFFLLIVTASSQRRHSVVVVVVVVVVCVGSFNCKQWGCHSSVVLAVVIVVVWFVLLSWSWPLLL